LCHPGLRFEIAITTTYPRCVCLPPLISRKLLPTSFSRSCAPAADPPITLRSLKELPGKVHRGKCAQSTVRGDLQRGAVLVGDSVFIEIGASCFHSHSPRLTEFLTF